MSRASTIGQLAPEGAVRDATVGRQVATRRALVVLGMHRSGTSALTRVLSLLGAELPSHLMPALPGINEAGFWESVEVADLNEEVLAAAGSSWDDVAGFPEAWLATEPASAFRERAVGVLERDFREAPLFVLKDPRLCRLLPFWLDVFARAGVAPAFALIVRNPLEVAASLEVRDGFSTAKSLLLWLRHTLEAERHTRTAARGFVAYESLLDDWRPAVERLSTDLDLEWPRRPAEAAGEIDDFLSDRLRHHRFDAVELAARPEAGGWVERAYRAACRASEGHAAEVVPAFEALRSELAAADRLFGPLLPPRREVGSDPTEDDLRAREARIAQLEELAAAGAAERERWAEERRASAERAGELAARVSARDFEIGRLQRELAALDRRLAEQARLLGEHESRLERARQRERRRLEAILAGLGEG